jgi:hypothetical protein
VNLLCTEEEPTLQKCCFLTAKKGICGKVSKWISPVDETQSYCNSHALKQPWIIPKKEFETAQLKKRRIEDLKEEWEQIRDKTVTSEKLLKPELVNRISAHYQTVCFSKVGTTKLEKNSNNTNLITICRSIKRTLDSDTTLEGTTHVIIENQISTIASRMTTIQGMITQYFVMRFGDSVHIEFVSSRNKLKGYKLAEEHDEDQAEKEKYKEHKTNGVIICRSFFTVNREMVEWKYRFEQSKKKDDLADCFLQAIWFMKTQELITVLTDNTILYWFARNKRITYAEDLKIISMNES